MRLLLVLFSCVVITLAVPKSYDGYKLYSLQLENDKQLRAFVSMQKRIVDAWERPNMANRPFRVMIDPYMDEDFKKTISEHHIYSKILTDDVQEIISREVRRNAGGRRKRSSPNDTLFDHFLRYQEITDLLQTWAKNHSQLMTNESVGKTYENRDLWLVKISRTNFDGSKPIIFIDANIHAREWISSMSALNLIHNLVTKAEEYPEMFAVDWMVMPMANPDGYEYSHTEDRLWRKNRSHQNGSSCLGADPNRNFAFKWDLAQSTSDEACSLIFRGSYAESEAEVKAISQLLRDHAKRIKLYLAVHSYGDDFLYPFGYNYNVPNPNKDNLISLAKRVSKAINDKYPHRNYTHMNSADLYPASGASDDFAMGAVGIPFAYTMELSSGASPIKFIVEPEKIQQISDEVFVGFREFAIWAGE